VLRVGSGGVRVSALALLVLALLGLSGPARGRSGLAPEERALAERLEARQPEMERTLRAWVEQNTGSLHLRGLERFADTLAEELRSIGLRVELREGPLLELPDRPALRSGPLIVARTQGTVRDASGSGARVLLNGHYDTVFEPDSDFREYRTAAGGRAVGPGTSDMKGGLVVMLEALRALRSEGTLAQARFTVLLNGDEELGSLGSRPLIEALSQDADLGLVFEAARENGAMVRSRRGLGQFHLRVNGVGAHAGGAHEQGRSAVLALAHKVIAIEALTDYAQGITLNVGSIEGGTKRNIVPSSASAWIDLRYDRVEQGQRVRGALERIAAQAHVEGTRAELWGQLHRPPKPTEPEVEHLLELHREVALALDLALPEPEHAGGGTDGSLMAAAGLPALDSVGAVGGEAHTEREFVVLESLSERAALTAILLRRLARDSLYAPRGGR
jgi:glutamate carboxypeptidase